LFKFYFFLLGPASGIGWTFFYSECTSSFFFFVFYFENTGELRFIVLERGKIVPIQGTEYENWDQRIK
jgi:hypothetical protein